MGAIYVYAIISTGTSTDIPTGEKMTFDVAGVDGDHGEVYSVPYHDVAAVVGASPLADYRGLERREAAAYLVGHQRVVEAVMMDWPLLPARFGTVLPGEDDVRRLLAQGEGLFRTALERFAGLTQMEVVVLWDLQEVFREIGQEETIAWLKTQIAGRPPEETVAERVAVGRLVQASLERRRIALRDRLLPPLCEVALDLVVNPLMDDSMVANVALLVNGERGEVLDQQLASLDGEFSGQLLFRCVGPLPPYSFATVQVQLPSFEAVDEARCRLGLGETAVAGEIKQAYRRLSSQLHPDHSPEDPEAESRMAALTRAYQLLTAYAESQVGEMVDAQQRVCCFDRQTIGQTLLIAVRGQRLGL